MNTSRKNTSTLDKVRAGLSYNDEDSVEFQDNFVSIGVQAEGIGYDEGIEVQGWAKAVESIGKWKIPNTRRAVDFLRPIYENNWNLEYVDGSMVGGLAATFSLVEACGSGDKAKGLRTYLKDYFSNVSRSKWTENTRGQSDVLIARKIVNKYNDLCDQGIIEGATIGEDLLTNNKLKDPATL